MNISMKRTPSTILLPASCSSAPTPIPSADISIGAGFRYSIYGPACDPEPEYWTSVGGQMSSLFQNAHPMGIWIIGKIEGSKATLNFPGISNDPNITFGATDHNETALTYFDQHNVQVWLQVEPGDAELLTLIDLVLSRYGNHPCVIGFGVDVEWYRPIGSEAEGTPVTDTEAAGWVAAVRTHNPEYRLFLKHWATALMPPAVRDGIVFIDDSQQFTCLDQMVDEFAAWGEAFTPAPVGFQFGYEADRFWWSALQDPPSTIGKAILSAVPNTAALFWVDFTVLEIFPHQP